MATGARARAAATCDEWIDAAEEAIRLADESGDLHLRVAIRAAGAYAHLCAGDFDGFEASARRGDRAGRRAIRSVGAGIVIGSPVAWAHMGKGLVAARARAARRGRSAVRRALRHRRRGRRPGDRELDPRQPGADAGRSAGEPEAGAALGAPQLRADRAARRRLLAQPRLDLVLDAQLAAGDYAAALESLEEAERLYREAMGAAARWRPGAAAARRGLSSASARTEEGLEAGRAGRPSRRSRAGMRLVAPLALFKLASPGPRARPARAGAEEARSVQPRRRVETGAAQPDERPSENRSRSSRLIRGRRALAR